MVEKLRDRQSCFYFYNDAITLHKVGNFIGCCKEMTAILEIKSTIIFVNRACSCLQKYIWAIQSCINIRFKNILNQLVGLRLYFIIIFLMKILESVQESIQHLIITQRKLFNILLNGLHILVKKVNISICIHTYFFAAELFNQNGKLSFNIILTSHVTLHSKIFNWIILKLVYFILTDHEQW